MTTPTGAMASFIAHARYSDFPQLAVDRAKIAISDYFACAVAGAPQPTSQKILAFLAQTGGPGKSTVPGTNVTASAPDAALANGTLAHALDYDDVSWRMNGHPGVAVLPAVFALAEISNKSGRDAIEAYIVGFEIAAKLGALLNRGHYEKGWHATGTFGTMGAAAGAARILELDELQTAHAIGIAGSMAAGMRRNFGTDTKPFHAGRAAQNGVTAAMLAGQGFTADLDTLETPSGFFVLYAGATPYDPNGLNNLYGNPLDIVSHGFHTKFYPSCVSTHAGIDAMLTLRAEHGLQPDDVVKIDAGVVDLTTKILIRNDPQTGLEAKFSIQYTTARALLSGAVLMSDFVDERVHEPEVQAIMKRVTMYIEPKVNDSWIAGNPRPTLLTLTLKDGSQLHCEVGPPTGSPGRELTHQQLETKYRDCMSGVIADAHIDESNALLLDLENVADVNEVTRLLGPR